MLHGIFNALVIGVLVVVGLAFLGKVLISAWKEIKKK